MAIREYICKTTGETRLEVYVNQRSEKNPAIRIQKYKKCKTKAEAERFEKILIRQVAQLVQTEEDRGSHWQVVLHKWESDAKKLKRNPTTLKPMSDECIKGTVGTLKLWTKEWLDKPCKELSIKQGKDLLLNAVNEDLRPATIRKIKTYVNLVYKFGVQEGIIEAGRTSPVYGVPFDLSDNDSLPEILTSEQSKRLLLEAKLRDHPWFPIWTVALTTGMRSSELYALRKDNVRFTENIIRVCESWDWENKCSKETKARYWRSAPISSSIKPILEQSMQSDPNSPYVFPRFKEWERGEQALVLREFCELIQIPSVRFHTLRACFATQLLIMGVDAATIMAIGGWSNYKTFKIYIRLSGVTERHKTEDLGRLLVPTENQIETDLSKAFEAFTSELPRTA